MLGFLWEVAMLSSIIPPILRTHAYMSITISDANPLTLSEPAHLLSDNLEQKQGNDFEKSVLYR